MTAATALPNAFDSPSEHLRWFFVFETHPPSSLAQLIPDPPGSLQLKCCPGPGGAANAPPAPRKKMPPIAAPRMRFMSPPPLGLVRFAATASAVPSGGVISQKRIPCQGEKKIGKEKKTARRRTRTLTRRGKQ